MLQHGIGNCGTLYLCCYKYLFSYYENSATAKLSDFYSVTVLDKLIDSITQLQSIVEQTSFTRDRWLGETSSTCGGGTPLYSGCFISGFM